MQNNLLSGTLSGIQYLLYLSTSGRPRPATPLGAQQPHITYQDAPQQSCTALRLCRSIPAIPYSYPSLPWHAMLFGAATTSVQRSTHQPAPTQTETDIETLPQAQVLSTDTDTTQTPYATPSTHTHTHRRGHGHAGARARESNVAERATKWRVNIAPSSRAEPRASSDGSH